MAERIRTAWPVQWRGQWTWYRRQPLGTIFGLADDAEECRNRVVLFRRRVNLDVVPVAVAVRAFADGRYALWVNGVEVARGPIRSEPGIIYYDQFDIAAHLHPGPNLVAATVHHYGSPVPWWRSANSIGELGRGCFVLESRELPELDSGPAWRATLGPWEQGPPVFAAPNERVDLRGIRGWNRDAEFDDSGWPAAVVLGQEQRWGTSGSRPPGAPFTVISPRPIPDQTDIAREAAVIAGGPSRGDIASHDGNQVRLDPLYRQGADFAMTPRQGSLPVSLAAGEGIVLDFGGMTLGLPEVEVSGAPGSVVELRSSDRVIDHRVEDLQRRWVFRATIDGERQRLEPFDGVGLRFLEVSSPTGATVHSVRLRERRYPLGEEGYFRASDPALGEIYEACRRTLQLCSTDAYLDCPGREQRAWLGDAYVHHLLAYVTGADRDLSAHVLRLATTARRNDGLLAMIAGGDLSGSAATIPEYSLHFITAAARSLDYVGDTGLVGELLPTCRGILDWFWSYVEEGVLQPLPGWPLVDWAPIPMAVPSASLNGLLGFALRDHAAVARRLGFEAEARLSNERHARLKVGFAAFLDGAGGVLEDPTSGLRTQHALAAAILGDLVDPATVAAALGRAVDPAVAAYPVPDPTTLSHWGFPAGFDNASSVLATQPFFAHWLHQAVVAAGRRDLLLASLRRWTQFLDTGDGTIWELWRAVGFDASHAHAWSGTPAYDLVSHVAGIRPGGPGFASVVVAPYLGDLDWVEAGVPTPHGPVRVELRREKGGIGGRVDLPAGVEGTLSFEELPGHAPISLHGGENMVSLPR